MELNDWLTLRVPVCLYNKPRWIHPSVCWLVASHSSNSALICSATWPGGGKKKTLHIYILDINWGACVPVKGTRRVRIEIKEEKKKKKTPENPIAVGRKCINCHIHKMPIFSQEKLLVSSLPPSLKPVLIICGLGNQIPPLYTSVNWGVRAITGFAKPAGYSSSRVGSRSQHVPLYFVPKWTRTFFRRCGLGHIHTCLNKKTLPHNSTPPGEAAVKDRHDILNERPCPQNFAN